ncbi:MAG: insulinase family protein [Muribaculaceae bacterium]|nr:insulinase family protein [Muribaculaceae bacterium]
MKKTRRLLAVLLLLLAVLLPSALMAQQMAIPVDQAVKIGKLDNGLTYYIRYNNYPEHRANFYIAQRVGAMQEEDNQNGLAHFLEHMAFNGSEHFNGKGHTIIDFIRSIGLNWGGDVNAYTYFTETVYNIDNVPTTSQGVLDSCLLVLKDWSNGLLLTDEEIDKERGVIHEEWRLGQSAMERMRNRQMDNLFPGSKYAKRDVIGDMNVVDNFPYQVLRDYYHKWYRPDNQAIVVVGDIDVDHTEAMIREMFSGIPLAADAAKVVDFPVPDNKEPIVIVEKDKEQQFSISMLMFKHDIVEKKEKNDINYLVINYAKQVLSQMLNQRLNEKAQEPDCPFMQAYGYDDSYMGANTKDAFTLIAVPKEGKTEAATQAVLIEALRAAKHGFTVTEYLRAKESVMSSIEKQYNERDKVNSRSYAQEYCRHYIHNEPIPSIEDYYQIMKMIAPQVPVEYINQVLPQLISATGENLVVLNFNQEKDGAVYPTTDGLMAAVVAAEQSDIEPYVDDVKDEPLIAQLPKKGQIVKETYNDTFGFKDLELSNGVRVLLKPTDFKKDQIWMMAERRGGKSLYGEKDRINIELLNNVLETSGLGGFSSTQLEKALAGKQTSVNQQVYSHENYITGSSTVKDLETMFQLIYLNFTDVTKDEKSFNQLYDVIEISLKNKDLSPENAFNDTLNYLINNRDWRSKPIGVGDLSQLDYDRCLEIAKEATSNAADYTFLFIGSFDEEVIRPLIEQYVASLPAVKGKKSNWVNTGNYPDQDIVNHFTRKMETPKTNVSISWIDHKTPYSLETSIQVNLLAQILDKIYNDKIREEAGAAYAVGAYGSSMLDGDMPVTLLQVSIPLQPKFTDQAVAIVNEEMLKACENIDAASLEDFKKALLKNFETQLKENSYWYHTIMAYAMRSIDNYSAYEQTVKAQTSETIAAFARRLLANGCKVEVVMSPEQ